MAKHNSKHNNSFHMPPKLSPDEHLRPDAIERGSIDISGLERTSQGSKATSGSKHGKRKGSADKRPSSRDMIPDAMYDDEDPSELEAHRRRAASVSYRNSKKNRDHHRRYNPDAKRGQKGYYGENYYGQADPFYDDPGYEHYGYSDNYDMPKKRRKKSHLGCLIPLIIIIAVILAIVYFLLTMTFSKTDHEQLDFDKITVNDADKNMKKYQNIALFGVDDQNNVISDRGSRSDSIIVASINKVTKQVKLMSIYRDTYASIDGQYDKINAAYSYGGPSQAVNTINRNLDLNVKDFVTINFKALADAVNIVGGVPLKIDDETELKNLNDYIGNMNKINGGDSPKFDSPGTYTFDGNQAVAYARIRYMAGGDHARANHQREVLQGILNGVKTHPWTAPRLVNEVLPQCKTSLSSHKLAALGMAMPLYHIKDSSAYPFHSEDVRYHGIYYGFPLTVKSNVIQAHEYLFDTKDYQPTDELERISAKIKYITDDLGLTDER